MRFAYADTSFVLSLAFAERPSKSAQHRFGDFDGVFASHFLEAEHQSTFRRDNLAPPREFLMAIRWVDSATPLTEQITRVLDAGYVRGADCWHLATALFAAREPKEWTFLTFDVRQRAVAKTLGFRV